MLLAMQNSGWGAVPWGAVLAFITAAAVILLVLIKDKLRKPVTFVTSDERDHDKREIQMGQQRLEEQFERLRDEVRAWEKEMRANCATERDVTALGEKVHRMEQFHNTVNDNAGKAMNRSSRALREVGHLRENVERVEESVGEIKDDLKPLTNMISRLDENVKTLLMQNGLHGSAQPLQGPPPKGERKP